jgi:hypothetical protein
MIGTISLIRRLVRTVLVPDVEIPQWKARLLSWLSLREGGILIAMHVGIGVFYQIIVDKTREKARVRLPLLQHMHPCKKALFG